jgi:hypothetical protein
VPRRRNRWIVALQSPTRKYPQISQMDADWKRRDPLPMTVPTRRAGGVSPRIFMGVVLVCRTLLPDDGAGRRVSVSNA